MRFKIVEPKGVEKDIEAEIRFSELRGDRIFGVIAVEIKLPGKEFVRVVEIGPRGVYRNTTYYSGLPTDSDGRFTDITKRGHH